MQSNRDNNTFVTTQKVKVNLDTKNSFSKNRIARLMQNVSRKTIS